MAFREVIIEKGGSITGRDKFYFGGEFSFLEKIKMGGTGSTKVIYESGNYGLRSIRAGSGK
jgi:hypothetical protein